MALDQITQSDQSIDSLVSPNTNSGPGQEPLDQGDQQSFAKQMFNVDDPSKILTSEGPSKVDPNKVRYRFAGDGKVYTVGKDKTPDQVLQAIWNHNAPGLLGSAVGSTMYGLPADASSALAYALNAGGFDQSSDSWRQYSDKLKTEFNQKYGQYMVPDAQAAWSQGKMMDYAMQTIGSGAPYVGLMLAGGAGGAAAAGAAGAETMGAGAMAGTFLGSTAITAPITVAQFADRQVANMKATGVQDPEHNIDWTSALGMGIAASGMQSLPVETILYGGPVLGALKGMGVDLGTNVSARILGNIADVAGTNAMVNMGSSVLSRAQSDMPLLDDKAQEEYFNAMISGGIIGIPFGIGRGVIGHGVPGHGEFKGATEKDIQGILSSNSEQASPTPPGQQGPIAPEKKMDYVFYNPENDYGIKDVYQAQEYMQNVKYRKAGVEHNAFDDLRSTSMHGPNFTDEQLINAARRVAFIRGREDLVGGSKQGIMFNTAEELPQRHSDDPKVLTRAAFLTDKAGYPDAQIRSLGDETINKLYAANIARITENNPQRDAMTKFALDNVDPKVIEDYKNFGSLTARPEAKERIQSQVDQNNKILSQNAREKLAQELMDKTSEMNQRPKQIPFQGKGVILPDQGATPEDIARYNSEGGQSPAQPETYQDRLNAFRANNNPNAVPPREEPFRAPVGQVVDALNNTNSKIPPKRLATWLADQPLFKKLAQTDDVAKELLGRVKKMNQSDKEPKQGQVRAEKEGSGQLSRGRGAAQDTAPNPRDVLADQKAYLESVARRDNENLLRQHPELAAGLNDLSKALAERMPKSNILDNNGKTPKDPGATTTKAVKTAPLLDVLSKRQGVLNSFTQAFKTISDLNSKYFTDTLGKLANGGELTVTELGHLSTVFQTAFDVKNNLRDVDSASVSELYKQIRSKLPLKQQMNLDTEVGKLRGWYTKSSGLNVRDINKFKPVDLEAQAFDQYMRGEFSPNLRDFRNSKHEQMFRQLNNVFRRLNKELGDQGVKSIDDVFAPNHAANEDIPPAARGRTTQNINDEIAEGPIRKENEQALQDFADKTQEDISNTPNDVAFRPIHDRDTLGGFGNNIGTPTLVINKMLSTVQKAKNIPAFAKLLASKVYETNKSAQFQIRMSQIASDTEKKHGPQRFNEAANTLAYLRKSNQLLKENGNGQFEVTQPDGTKVTLSREFGNRLKDVNSVFKEAPKIATEVFRKQLDYFDEEGLNQNTSIDGMDRALDKLTEGIKGNVIPEQRSRLMARRQAIESIRDRIKEFQQVLDDQRPYVPFMRFGDYVAQVVDKTQRDDDGKFKTVHLQSINDANLFGLRTKLPTDKEAKQFMESQGLFKKYGDKSKYELRHFQMTHNNATRYINKNLRTHELIQGLVASGMNDSISAADIIARESTGISEDEARTTMDNLHNKVSQDDSRIIRLLNARGMGRFGVESQNIEGHSNDWHRVTEAYTNIFANSLARADNAREWSRNLSNIELEEGIPDALRKELRDWTEYVTNPSNDWAHVRQFNYLMALGFRPMSGVLQLFTLPQQTLGNMLSYNMNHIRNMWTLSKNFSKSIARVTTGAKTFSPEIEALLDKNKPMLRGTIKRDTLVAFGKSNRPVEKFLGKAIDTAGIMLTGAERTTRESSFVSHYELLQNKNFLDRVLRQRKDDHYWNAFWDKNKGDMSLPEAMSLYNMEEEHSLFGKLGRSPLQKGIAGSVFFPFTGYSQQILEALGSQLMGQRGIHGALGGLWTIGSYLGLAGMAGIPGWDLWKTLIETVEKNSGNVGFDTEMWLKEQGFPVWARKGVMSTATGMDLSNRLSQNVVGVNILQGLLKGDVKFNDLFGLPGTAASGFVNGMQELFNPLHTTESSLKAFMPAMPAVMQDAIKAQQMMTNPASSILQTNKGVSAYPGGKPNNQDIATQLMGATPLDKTLQRERIYWNQKVTSEFTQFKQRVAENLAQAQWLGMNGNEAEGSQIKAQVSKELTRYARDNKMMLTPEFWSGLNKSVQQRLQQKINPGSIRGKLSPQQILHSRALYGEETY